MVSPLRVRLLYWTVYASCFTGTLFFSWHFLRGNTSSEIRYAFPSIALFFSQLSGTIVCRFLGYSLERRVETRIEPQAEDSLQGEVEVRSYLSSKLLKAFVWVGLGLSAFFFLFLVGLSATGHQLVAANYWSAVLPLVLAGLCWLMSYYTRNGKPLAKVNDQGIELYTGGKDYKFIPWMETVSATRIETFNLLGNLVNNIIEFRDARGRVLTQILLNDTLPEQQRQFSQVVSRYLRPSDTV